MAYISIRWRCNDVTHGVNKISLWSILMVYCLSCLLRCVDIVLSPCIYRLLWSSVISRLWLMGIVSCMHRSQINGFKHSTFLPHWLVQRPQSAHIIIYYQIIFLFSTINIYIHYWTQTFCLRVIVQSLLTNLRIWGAYLHTLDPYVRDTTWFGESVINNFLKQTNWGTGSLLELYKFN